MTVFIVSNHDELKTQNWYCIKVAVTRLFSTTTCLQTHWTRSLSQAIFCSNGTLPTSIKPEATAGERIDLRISGQPEELCTLNEKEAKVFFISSSMKQVLKCRQMQNKSITIVYHIEIEKSMLRKTVSWNDTKFQRSKIVFNAKYALNLKDQAGSMQQGITEEVKKRVIIEECSKASTIRAFCRSTKTRESERLLGFLE